MGAEEAPLLHRITGLRSNNLLNARTRWFSIPPPGIRERASEPRFRRSSLKERGRVKALVTSGLGCLRPRRTRRDRRRGQGSGGARPRSGRRALRSAPGSTNNVGGGDSAVGGSSEVRMGWRCARQGRGPGWGQARVGCRSSLRRGRGRHDGVRGALAGGVNQRGDHAR